MAKFKVGDRVQRISPISYADQDKTNLVRFGIYTVTFVSENHDGIDLEGVTNPTSGTGGWWDSSCFKLAEGAPEEVNVSDDGWWDVPREGLEGVDFGETYLQQYADVFGLEVRVQVRRKQAE